MADAEDIGNGSERWRIMDAIYFILVAILGILLFIYIEGIILINTIRDLLRKDINDDSKKI